LGFPACPPIPARNIYEQLQIKVRENNSNPYLYALNIWFFTYSNGPADPGIAVHHRPETDDSKSAACADVFCAGGFSAANFSSISIWNVEKILPGASDILKSISHALLL
jgi:hypothetical protein